MNRSHMPRPPGMGVGGMPRPGVYGQNPFAAIEQAAQVMAQQQAAQQAAEAELLRQVQAMPPGQFQQMVAPVVAPPTQHARTESVATADALAAFVPPVQDQQGDGEQEVIRWGDQQTFQFTAGGTFTTSGQLVKVHRRFAEDWNLLLYANNSPDPAGAHDVEATFQIVLGVGAAQVTFNFFVHWNPSASTVTQDYTSIELPGNNTNYNIFWLNLELPVKNLQVNATVGVNAVGAVAGQCMLAAFAAPRVFQPNPQQAPPAVATPGNQTTQWMPPGFHPEPVHYP